MPEVKKQYSIEFVYAENGQIFQTGAMLTEDEKRDFERVLERYEAVGAIEQVMISEPKSVPQDFDAALDEVREALIHEVDDEDMSKCQNCDLVWADSILINPIPDLSMRVAPGEIMPSGECPACGAVCHTVKKSKKAKARQGED